MGAFSLFLDALTRSISTLSEEMQPNSRYKPRHAVMKDDAPAFFGT